MLALVKSHGSVLPRPRSHPSLPAEHYPFESATQGLKSQPPSTHMNIRYFVSVPVTGSQMGASIFRSIVRSGE